MQASRSRPASAAMPPLALLAGGLATRLGAVTAQVPKSLLEVAGEPFIAHQLRLLAAQGIGDVVLCTGHLDAQIRDFVHDGSQFGLTVRYSHDGPVPLGTGGAIRNALPLLGDRFWVMYGDSYLLLDFHACLSAFERSGKDALMTVYRNCDQWDASNVEFADGCILRYTKRDAGSLAGAMRHIDYGLSIFRAQAFQQWPQWAAFDLATLQTGLVARGRMAGFEVADRFYEIGSPSGLRETDSFLRAHSASRAAAVVGAGI